MAVKRVTENMDDVVILVPAYNEGSLIRGTIENISDSFKHIICVNDGSTDNTRNEVLHTQATLVEHAINLGQGAALQTAVDYALLNKKHRYFVTYDADGQHRIEDVKKMLKIIKKHELDIVLGSRFLGNTVDISYIKKLMLKLAVMFSNISTGLKLTDTHNGLRVFNRRTAENLQLQLPDFAHASEVIERIAAKGFKYAEAPVTITYTKYSRSKGQSVINAFNIFFDVLLNKIIKR